MRSYNQIVTVNGTSYYAGNGDPNGTLAATRGSVYSDKNPGGQLWKNVDGLTTWSAVGGGGGGTTNFTVWRPDGPAGGDVYLTFTAAHSAAASKVAASGLPCDIICQDDATMTTEAGVFDMTLIKLIGINLTADPNLSQPVVRTAAGATFTNWYFGAENMTLIKLGAGVLCTFAFAPGDLKVAQFGPYATVLTLAGGGAGIIYDVSGPGSSFVMRMLDGATFAGGDGGLAVKVGPFMTLELQMFSRTDVEPNLLDSDVTAAVNYSYHSSSRVQSPQAANLGTVTPVNPHFPYIPTVLGDWSGVDPAEISVALDRIAAVLSPIP